MLLLLSIFGFVSLSVVFAVEKSEPVSPIDIERIVANSKLSGRYDAAVQCYNVTSNKCHNIHGWEEDITFQHGDIQTVGLCIVWENYCQNKLLDKLDENKVLSATKLQSQYLLKSLMAGSQEEKKFYMKAAVCAGMCEEKDAIWRNFKVNTENVPSELSSTEVEAASESFKLRICLTRCAAPEMKMEPAYRAKKVMFDYLKEQLKQKETNVEEDEQEYEDEKPEDVEEEVLKDLTDRPDETPSA